MKPDQDRSIETLIRLAGEREMPSEAATERARLAAEQSWRRMLDEAAPRARWRRPLAWAAAACVALMAAWLWLKRDVAAPAVFVAQVVTVEGRATLRENDAENALARDASLMSGTVLTTANGRVATSLAGALSLRLDQHTTLRFDAPDHVTLLQGGLYVDSGGLGTGPPLTISAPAGDLRHVGTQFQLRVMADTTRIRVREGRVALGPEKPRAWSRRATSSKYAAAKSAGGTGWRRSAPSGTGRRVSRPRCRSRIVRSRSS